MATIAAPIAFSGVGGNVSFGIDVISVREWKMTISGDPINVTSTADGGFKDFILGPTGAEGTFRVNADCVDMYLTHVGLTPSATLAVPCAVVNSFQFNLGNGNQNIKGSGIITKVDIVNPASEEVTYEFSFVSTSKFQGYV